MKKWLLPVSILLMLVSIGTLIFLLIGNTKEPETNITQGDTKTESAASSETKEDPLKPSEIFKKEFKSLSTNQVELPKTLTIDSLKVKTNIEQVGLDKKGAMGTPKNEQQVGWYKFGPRPGDVGNAVIDGHTDTKTGPAVFYQLHELKKGDKINIKDESGRNLVFRVKKLVEYGHLDAPLEKIFGASDQRNLNLITCIGTYDENEGTYDNRLVVFTELDQKASDPVKTPPKPATNVRVSSGFVNWYASTDDEVVTYNIYQEQDGKRKKLGSTESIERKAFPLPQDTTGRFIITAVNKAGIESEEAFSAVQK
ncbi:peptidase C60 sortase A and B [Exiguobacterium sibiricum 255-15]|uniref:Peptidase C60 sortase A and B n=1 Tax=Exiguobacterium sibiricum (strain DSM 17290 / CCUG 55495 / CIP 109462 / JCM 13490 / 255-15) TaxID=262543 RepID=B1YMP9_EXIS2|nr:class F sortase [Exiguobacterium sibiricum]ACB62109.1 peptidase C60 sortase A and B [Exiguobacterium sibiricum 255-15]